MSDAKEGTAATRGDTMGGGPRCPYGKAKTISAAQLRPHHWLK
jgi:hypothetical protein